MTNHHERSVDRYLASLDAQTVEDSETLIEMLQRISSARDCAEEASVHAQVCCQ